MEVEHMTVRKFAVLCCFVSLSLAPCFAHHLAVVVEKSNAVDSLTPGQLAAIFRAEMPTWQNGKPITIVLHRDSTSELQTLQHLNKMSADDLKAHIAAHSDSILLVDSDADLLRAVQSNPGAIGMVEVRSVTDQVKVLKIGGKLPGEAGYLPH
jgi:ABC-type phosphate transport system substrate-binding protein